MLSLENLRAGDIDASLAELQDAVRAEPADSKKRIYLFQLLAVMGDWKRALTQLKVLGEMDPATLPMVQTYREALQCELYRHEVFAGQRSPLVFGDPEPWVAEMVQALALDAESHHTEAAALRERAFEAAPATSGSLNGEPFQWIADADMRMGPILEMIVNGSFYWVPVHRIQKLEAGAPADLRDLVWAPVNVTWANSGQSVALMPARYPGTENADNDQLRLSRRTEWQSVGDDAYVGIGQRVLATDTVECSLLEVRSLLLDTATSDAESAQGEVSGA